MKTSTSQSQSPVEFSHPSLDRSLPSNHLSQTMLQLQHLIGNRAAQRLIMQPDAHSEPDSEWYGHVQRQDDTRIGEAAAFAEGVVTDDNAQPVLRKGSRGAAVARLQKALNNVVAPPLLEDGIFGALTRAAVIAFQQQHHLVPDGIVGPKTWSKLNTEADTETADHVQSETAGGLGVAPEEMQDNLSGTENALFGSTFFPTLTPGSILTVSIDQVFEHVLKASIATASPVIIPAEWYKRMLRFGRANLADGLILGNALARLPLWYHGGIVLKLVPGAVAMTMDRHVFAKPPLSLATYIHELVHVWQYAAGRVPFLVTFFGASAATIAYRWMRGLPLSPMTSSPHETQAYNLEGRFKAWHMANYGVDAETVTI